VEVDPTEKFIKYHCFLYKEFSRFVIKDLLGSVQSMMDGLKTTQRKVLFAAMEDLKEKKQMTYSVTMEPRLMFSGWFAFLG